MCRHRQHFTGRSFADYSFSPEFTAGLSGQIVAWTYHLLMAQAEQRTQARNPHLGCPKPQAERRFPHNLKPVMLSLGQHLQVPAMKREGMGLVEVLPCQELSRGRQLKR